MEEAEVDQEVHEVVQEPRKRRSRRTVIRNAAAIAVVLLGAGAGIGIAVSSSGPTAGATTGNGGSGPPAVGGKGAPPGGGAGFRGAGAPSAAGTVESVDASSGNFTVKETSGTTVTVAVTSSTTYFDPGVSTASLKNLVDGEKVAVIGTTSSGTVKATRVVIGFAGGQGGARPGVTGSQPGTST